MAARIPDDPRFHLSEEALFRYSVVSLVRARLLGGLKLAQAVQAVVGMSLVMPGGQARAVKKRTVYRWLAAYQKGGAAGLEPAGRRRTSTSCVLPAELLGFLRAEREDDPLASIPEMLERAAVRGVLPSVDAVDRTTVWRAMVRMGLPTRRARRMDERDARRFAYPHRMQMLLCDGKKFRVGIGRLRRVALFFLDDATRYGLHVVVGVDSESTELFLRGLYECIRRWGLFSAAFTDNGPGFISDDTHAVFANLDKPLILGTAGYPEGHGKIERFNRTVKADVLRGLDRAAGVDPDPRALELRLRHYLGLYNRTPHASLDDDTPQSRWDADPRPLRFAESDAELRSLFVVTEPRTVSKDNVLRHGGGLWEVPLGHADRKVRVHRHLLDQTLSIVHQGRLVRLHPVDLTANAHARRARPAPAGDEGECRMPPTTAAALAFQRDFGPIVGPDGGFTDREED